MKSCRVMVVDEDADFREMLCVLLDEYGFRAYPAADGIDALRQIYTIEPQLIVAAAELSCLSGFDFLPFVRRRFPEIGVMALRDKHATASARPDADCILEKQPWDAYRFIGAIAKLAAEFPFRHEQDAKQYCGECEQLLRAVSTAKLNNFLVSVWSRMHPTEANPQRLSPAAEEKLKQALFDLNAHMRRRHLGAVSAIGSPEPQLSSFRHGTEAACN